MIIYHEPLHALHDKSWAHPRGSGVHRQKDYYDCERRERHEYASPTMIVHALQ